MKKSLGVKPFVFPMPVLMVATYNEDSTVNVMNMAWGGICGENLVALNIEESHKTAENIKMRRAFTLSIADVPHLEEADFFGIVSGNEMPDKFEKTGLKSYKSDKVDAPIIDDFPITLECKVLELQSTEYGFRVLGEILDVLAEERVLNESGKVEPQKLNALIFEEFQHEYYAIGEKVGKAWHCGDKYITRN
ncbi:flavin reductase [Bacillota bacterium]